MSARFERERERERKVPLFYLSGAGEKRRRRTHKWQRRKKPSFSPPGGISVQHFSFCPRLNERVKASPKSGRRAINDAPTSNLSISAQSEKKGNPRLTVLITKKSLCVQRTFHIFEALLSPFFKSNEVSSRPNKQKSANKRKSFRFLPHHSS